MAIFRPVRREIAWPPWACRYRKSLDITRYGSYPEVVLLKRLTALLFILFLVGQVWAGVCNCMQSGMRGMACCKHKKVKGDSMRRTDCCDGPCGIRTSDRQPRMSADVTVRVDHGAEIPQPKFDFRPRAAAPFTNSFVYAPVRVPSQLSRPPNLYLQYRSLLI